MTNIDDFMFGNIRVRDENYIISLNDFKTVAEMIITPEKLRNEINRLLNQIPTRHIYAESSSSNYALSDVLKHLPLDIVNASVLTRRENKNTNINYTLSLSLYFDNGILELSSDWCMYKGFYD